MSGRAAETDLVHLFYCAFACVLTCPETADFSPVFWNGREGMFGEALWCYATFLAEVGATPHNDC